jgi:hypothetical protein
MSTKNNIRPDPAEIARALDILVEPESVFELRVLKTGKTRTVRGYFDNIDAAVEAAAAWSGRRLGERVAAARSARRRAAEVGGSGDDLVLNPRRAG